ncbi:hypothetical protein Hte_001415 [Hypoxylon texense]
MSDAAQREVIARMLNLVNRLQMLGDKFFPAPSFDREQHLNCEDDMLSDEDEAFLGGIDGPYEPTMLWNDNISLDNILVDKQGVLRGIIDWECVSCLPLYEACQFPAFLQQARDRFDEPPTPYRVNRTQHVTNQVLRAYEIELRQHHVSMLRREFLVEMRNRCPQWIHVFRHRADLRDYEAAAQNCDNEFAYKIVERWATSVEGGSMFDEEYGRLHEVLMH